MKKIILIMLILIVSACILLAEQIDRERYMPRKLINSELSDEYPDDMEFLFRCNYDFIMDTFNAMKTSDENPIHIQKKMIRGNISKMQKLSYLTWLAQHLIPQYYAEYQLINSRYVYSFLNHDIELDKKLNELSYVLQKFGSEEKHDISSIFLASSTARSEIENSNVLNYIWVRAKVLKTDTLSVRKFNNNLRLTSFVTIEIVEDISGIFPYQELEIECFYTGDEAPNPAMKLLEKDKEYLIPIRWFQRQHSITENYVKHYPLVYQSARLADCMLIENEYLTTFDIQTMDSNLVIESTDEYWIRKIFGSEISYKQAKSIIKSRIDLILNLGGIE